MSGYMSTDDFVTFDLTTDDEEVLEKVKRAVMDNDPEEVGKILAGAYPDNWKSRTHPAVRQRRKAIVDEMMRLHTELVELANIPTEPSGTYLHRPTIQFNKKWSSDRVYTYVGVRADDGLWYITGRRGAQRGINWPDLVDWINKHETSPPEIWTASGFSRVS